VLSQRFHVARRRHGEAPFRCERMGDDPRDV